MPCTCATCSAASSRTRSKLLTRQSLAGPSDKPMPLSPNLRQPRAITMWNIACSVSTMRQLLREKTSVCGRCGNECLRRQPSIGIGREQKVLGFPAQRLSQTQDVTAVIDGGRLSRTIAFGCQVESSRIRTPPEEMSSVVTSRLVGSDDARSRIYSDRGAGQTQYHGSDAILEHSCHRLTI